MPNWKKVIVSGSNAILSNITASGDISANGDIYANNFYGTASIASAVNVQALNSPGFFDVLFTNGSNLFLTDSDTNDFTYNPSTNTLLVDNVTGTASLANKVEINDYVSGGSVDIILGNTNNSTLYIEPDSGLTYNFDTDTLNVDNLEGTASLATTSSYALTASYVEGGTISINGNTNNNILTATGTDTLQGESNLTFNGSTLNINGGITVNPQGYQGFIDLSNTVGGASVNIGDENQNNNGTFFKVDDENSNITFNFGDPTITHTVTSTGFDITGNITASNDISASGDVYADNVRTDTIIFPNVGGKITTPDGQINDDYVTLDGTNRYFSVVLDATDLLKVDFNNELITLGESTKHGSVTNDTHQFTGSVDIKGDTNIDGNLVINGDITAEQYIVNSTVTNVTMSFSSGSTIFGDSLDDTHLFTGSVDITGSLTVDGMLYPTTDGSDGQTLHTDGAGNLTFEDTNQIFLNVKNKTGAQINKGTPLYASGSSGNGADVYIADASDPSKMPAAFIAREDIAIDAEGKGVISGFVNGIDTSGFSAGDTIYVAGGGGYTNVKPTGSDLIQNIGKAIKIDGSNGSLVVIGAGRSNDMPNIPAGYAWVGNSDGVATAVPTSSFESVGDNLGNHIATQDLDMAGFSISASFNITASGNISASGDIIGNSLYSDETINIKGTEYPTSSFYLIETEPGQTYKEGFIQFSGSIDDTTSTVFDLFAISTGSNQVLKLNYNITYYRSDILWTTIGYNANIIVGPTLAYPQDLNSQTNPQTGEFYYFEGLGNSVSNYVDYIYDIDGGETLDVWSTSIEDDLIRYSLDYGASTITSQVHENGDEVKININYKLLKSI